MKKAPALLLALVVAAVRGDDCSFHYYSDDYQAACSSDSDCVWLDRWWSCRDNCEGGDEDGCDDADHCAWSDSSNTCSLSCEHKYIDGYYHNHDEDACDEDTACVWVAHSVLRL